MKLQEIITFSIYFAALLLVGLLSSRKQQSEVDYIMGGRSLNFWLTALSAHASDMSSWLFLAYPALIYVGGMPNAFAAIGLTFCMYLNWQFIAPKIRIATEQTTSLTLSAFFENRLADKSNILRIVSALASLLFYTIYIAAGLVGMGILVESLFDIPYYVGIIIGLLIVMIYVFAGGYKTVAWIDLFQGFFLLAVILFIPAMLISQIGGFSPILKVIHEHGISTKLIPNFEPWTLWTLFSLMMGWGLGYFGQPHILTKFMGIKNVSDMAKSKYVGISWQILALGGATLVGLIGIYLFQPGMVMPDGTVLSAFKPEEVIIETAKLHLPGIVSSLVLCAVLAATTNVMAAQILVVASSLSEDFYKTLVNKEASGKTLLRVSRISVVLISLIAFFIASLKTATIYGLVLYAWSGLGGTFGPLLIACLYSKNINRFGGIWGVIIGALFGTFWPAVEKAYGLHFPAMFAAFLASSFTIYFVSYITRNKYSVDMELDG